jgi:hypothetical protein
MAAPMFEPERRARRIDALPIPGAQADRDLVAFRRRRGLLPGPAAKLLNELRALTASASA